MEPQHFPRYITRNSNNSKLRLFSESSSRKDPEVIDITPVAASHGPNTVKRKHNQAVPFDVIEIDGDENPSGVVITGNEGGISGKNKNKATMGHGKHWQKQSKDAFAKDFMAYTNLGLASSASWNPHETSGLGSQNLNYSNKFNSDFMDIDDAISLAPQYNSIHPPPWVEASIPWLQKPACLKPGTSSSTVSSQSSSCKQQKGHEDKIAKKFELFKQFDTIRNHSDHYYNNPSHSIRSSFHGVSLTEKAPMEWSKKIQQEWRILRKDLPESIFIRVYEERMDLLRAVIAGAAGTPYHDGLFFFDILFPSNYPCQPPLVYYHSGGLRLNPNLYECGKVCLSLLNTWPGSKSEQWTPGKSTILQVLLSIQALVLNAKPFFNEPGYVSMAGTPEGEKRSLAYNEQAFLLSCRTMMYTLQKPPKNFEDLVVGHFCQRAHSILEACKAYMEGAQVGCLVGGGVQDVDEGDKSCSSSFKHQLGQLFPRLLKAFTDNGADCRQFLHQSGNSQYYANAAHLKSFYIRD